MTTRCLGCDSVHSVERRQPEPARVDESLLKLDYIERHHVRRCPEERVIEGQFLNASMERWFREHLHPNVIAADEISMWIFENGQGLCREWQIPSSRSD